MVAGEDTYNYMLHDPAPCGDWDLDLKNWQGAYDRQHINYYEMEQTPASPYNKFNKENATV